MSLYSKISASKQDQEFSKEEIQSIEECFDSMEKPIHYYFRTNVRINKESLEGCVVALSPHFVLCFKEVSKRKKVTIMMSLHIGLIRMIGYSDEQYVLIKSETHNVILFAEEALRFAQLLYRNYQLGYPSPTKEKFCELKSTNMDLFPKIVVPISPIQKFQFSYLSMCTEAGVPYFHEVVRYIHSLFLSKNSIIDISQFPIQLFSGKKSNDELSPVFQTIGMMDFVSGICCSGLNNPRLLQTLVHLISSGTQFKIIHFENCGSLSGMRDLSLSIRGKKEFNVSYWHLKNNPIKDMEYFSEILSFCNNPLLYMNLSNCGIKPQDAISLFTVMSKNSHLWDLKHLYLAGTPFQETGVMTKFGEYLSSITSKGVPPLETLDISGSADSIESLIVLLNTFPLHIKSLNISNSFLSPKAFSQIMIYLQEVEVLHELDISGTNYTYDKIFGVLDSISKNPHISKFSLKLDRIRITSNGVLPIIRSFMNSDKSKWVSLSFNDCSLSEDDILNLTPLFRRLPNLEELSLSFNFDNTMRNVGEVLSSLTKIQSLRKLSIAGNGQKSLGNQLLPLLQSISDTNFINEIDISGNNVGNAAIPIIIQIIRSNPNISSLSIDNNILKSVELIEEMVSAISDNKSLISFQFPINDSRRIVNSAKKANQTHLISKFSDMQFSTIQSINRNRSSKRMPTELPFTVSPEIARLVWEITINNRKSFQGLVLTEHSCASEVLHVPLPFQSIGDKIENGGTIKEFAIGDMDIYQTPSLGKIVVEDQSKYQDFCYTTLNPDFNAFVNQESVINESDDLVEIKATNNYNPQESDNTEEEPSEDENDEFILNTKVYVPPINPDQVGQDVIGEEPTTGLYKIPPLRKTQIADDVDENETVIKNRNQPKAFRSPKRNNEENGFMKLENQAWIPKEHDSVLEDQNISVSKSPSKKQKTMKTIDINSDSSEDWKPPPKPIFRPPSANLIDSKIEMVENKKKPKPFQSTLLDPQAGSANTPVFIDKKKNSVRIMSREKNNKAFESSASEFFD